MKKLICWLRGHVRNGFYYRYIWNFESCNEDIVLVCRRCKEDIPL